MSEIDVTFLPGRITVSAHCGDTVLDAALDHDLEIPHECGGNCACTTCHVIVVAGREHLSPMEEAEADRLATAEGLMTGSRLSCQALLCGGEVVVTIVDEGWRG